MRAAFHRHGGGLHGAHAGGADAVHRKRFHRRRGHLALNHAGKAGHQRITARRAAGQITHIGQRLARQRQRVLNGVLRHLRVAEDGLAFAINRVVAVLDAVFGQDAALDALGDAVQRRDICIHPSVVHGSAGQKHASGLQIDV